jgi:hypothetical protein
MNFKFEFVSSVVISAIFLLMLFIPGMVFAGGAGSSNARFENDVFGFSIRMPDGWALETEETPGELTVTATEPKDNGTVFVISVDLPGAVPVRDFIAIMEDELAKELSFMKMHEGKEISPGSGDRPGARPLTAYREYRGRYYGFKMKTLAGYAVSGNRGYCIAGVFAEADKDMEELIKQSMDSFRLDVGGLGR